MKGRWIYLLPVAVAMGLAVLFYQWSFAPGNNPPSDSTPAPTPSIAVSPPGVHAVPGSSARPNLAGRQAAGPSAKTLSQQGRKALESGNHDQFIDLLIQLVQIDPDAAIALAQSSGSFREEAMRRVAQHWSEYDPDAAEKWAASVPNAEERELTMTAVCYQVAESDPEAAIGIAGKHGIGRTKGVFPDLAEQWAAKDFPAAEEWASTQPIGTERSEIFARLTMILAKTEPENAVRLVLKEIPAGPAQSEAAISVLYQWASHDHAGAAAWVANFPPGELKQRAERELAGIAADHNTAQP